MKNRQETMLDEKRIKEIKMNLALRLVLYSKLYLRHRINNKRTFIRHSSEFAGSTILRTMQKRGANTIKNYLVKRNFQWMFRNKLNDTMKHIVNIQKSIRS